MRLFSVRLEIFRVLTQDGKNIQHLEDDIGSTITMATTSNELTIMYTRFRTIPLTLDA